MPNCSVYCCKKKTGYANVKKNGITFHKFPKDPNLRDLWKKFCNNKLTWIPTTRNVICSDHFKASDFKVLANKSRGLVKGTQPTLLSHCTCPSYHLRHSPPNDTLSRVTVNVAASSTSSCTSSTPQYEYDPSLNCSATPADQILVVPEPNDMIVNVYHYLQNEYQILKKSLATTGCELSYLADILKRTAEATGASKDAVTKILRNRKISQDPELATATTAEKRSKADYYFDDDDVSVIEEDSGSEKEVCESDRGAEDNNCSNDVRKSKPMDPLMETLRVELEQTDQMDPVIETLKIEIDEQLEENTEAANELIRRDLLESSQSTTAVQYFSSFSVSPTYVEVKIEPPDEDLQSTVHRYSTEPCVHVTNDATCAPPPPPPGADAPSGPPPS